VGDIRAGGQRTGQSTAHSVCHAELAELAAAPAAIGSVVIAKVDSAGDLAFVERLLDGTPSSEPP
jgi:hypothetical protein